MRYMVSGNVRRDKRGRRIGRNWWREWNHELWFYATAAWERQCEEVAIGYGTETADYEREHPRPQLKEFLLANAGQADRQEVA